MRFSPIQMRSVNKTMARHSLPTRATSSAKPGMTATTAAQMRASRSSPNDRRAMLKIKGMMQEAMAMPSHRIAST